MPPKKGTTKKKKGKVSKPKAPLPLVESDRRLPPITDVRCATLQAAVIGSDRSSLERLVAHYDYGSSLSLVDANGSTLVHIAVKRRDHEMLRALLAHRAIDVNRLESASVGGHTALFHACALNDPRAVEILLQAGASPDVKSESLNGETALMICCKEGFLDCARLLLAHGASLDVRDNFGNNASFWAYKNQQTSLIRELNLPQVHTPDANQFLKLLLAKNFNFVFPSLVKEKKKSKKGDKDGKKKK